MPPFWPDDVLPRYPLKDGSEYNYGEGRAFFENDSGPAKTRLRFSAVAEPATVNFRMTVNQVARFRRFFIEETVRGSRPFYIRDPLNDGEILMTDDNVPLLNDDGEYILQTVYHLALFGQGVPTVVNVSGKLYNVSFQYSVMP